MAKRTSKACVVQSCRRSSSAGLKLCSDHQHPTVLQNEIERLLHTREGGWQRLLDDFPALREIGEHLRELEFRAHAGKGGSFAALRRGSGFDDNTKIYGTEVVHSSGAAAVKKDQGRLGAAKAKVNGLVRELEGLLDPGEGKKDLRVTCGRCPDKNQRHKKQPVDSIHCRYCGAKMAEKSEEQAEPQAGPPADGKEPEPEPSKPAQNGHQESTTGPTDSQESRSVSPGRPINGSQAPQHRIVTVEASSSADACTEGLDLARSIFKDLDVMAVLEAEPLPESQWRVTVKVS